MSSRTLLFFWLVFLLLHILDPAGKDTAPTKFLFQNQTNTTWLLGNLTYKDTDNFTEIAEKLDDLYNITTKDQLVKPLYYQNITGLFKGKWRYFNLSHHNIPYSNLYNETWALENRGSFDFSSIGGVGFHLYSNHSAWPFMEDVDNSHAIPSGEESGVRYLTGYVKLKGHRFFSSGGLLIALHGAHFVHDGQVFLAGMANGNGSTLDDIPRMMLSNKTFEIARNLSLGVNHEHLRYLQTQLDENPDGEQDLDLLHSDTKCKFHIFMQLSPVAYDNQTFASSLELMNPEGLPTISSPDLFANAYIYSPDCGIFLQIDQMRGLKLERYYRKTTNYVVLVWLMTFAELYLVMKQMEYTATQSALSKVSLITIGMQTVIDAYLCMLHFASGGLIGHMVTHRPTTNFSNVRRNARKAFLPRYVYGMTAARLVLPLYFYGCPDNIGDFGQTHITGLFILLGWVGLQVAVLTVQDVFGPRVFLPETVILSPTIRLPSNHFGP
ncbi:hypothetical protein HDV05_006701 [Chytridiales sp. JEL 0842]|nr:hypothetical protein HDV05_006701 [Chytridiales sp. JEL 0842]